MGEFKRQLKQGFGVTRFENGDVQVGEYEEDEATGFGISVTKKDNGTYLGQWKEGMFDGLGMYFDSKGVVQVAFFRDDIKNGPGIEIDTNVKGFRKVLWKDDEKTNSEPINF